MPWPKGKPHSSEMVSKRVASLKQSGGKRRKPKQIDGIEHWKCPTCERWLPPTAFYRKKRAWNGLSSQCRSCHNEGNIRTRDVDKHRDARREHMARARARDPDKFRAREREASRDREWDERREARYQLNLAVRRGDVSKPGECQMCGRRVRLTGHHPDYSKPLQVYWLCYRCHGQLHRTAEAANGD